MNLFIYNPLTEGTPNIHPGQGTANRRFFFQNNMLELLWVHNPAEAQSEITRPMHLWQRWVDRDQGACPFGFCLRPNTQFTQPNAALPFPTWAYRPAYLPDSISIAVATNAHLLTEPMLFYLPFGKRPDSYSDQRQPLHHSARLAEITRVTLVSPYANQLSPELQSMVSSKLIEVKQGETYLMELGFDKEKQEQQADFRPTLPLTLSW
jgi:hypothetical protein